MCMVVPRARAPSLIRARVRRAVKCMVVPPARAQAPSLTRARVRRTAICMVVPPARASALAHPRARTTNCHVCGGLCHDARGDAPLAHPRARTATRAARRSAPTTRRGRASRRAALQSAACRTARSTWFGDHRLTQGLTTPAFGRPGAHKQTHRRCWFTPPARWVWRRRGRRTGQAAVNKTNKNKRTKSKDSTRRTAGTSGRRARTRRQRSTAG